MMGRLTGRSQLAGAVESAHTRPERLKVEEVPGLADRRRAIFQAAFDHYRATEEWPQFRKVARDLVEEVDVEEAVQGLGYPWVEGYLGNNNPIVLRIPAIALCQGSDDVLSAFMAALKLGVKKYFTKGMEPILTQQNLVSDAGLSNELAHRTLLLLKSENVWEGIKGTTPGDMEMTLSGSVRKYREVNSIEQFLAISMAGAGEKALLGSRQVALQSEESRDGRRSYVPDTAFVMMWLGPDNPERDAVAAAIRESFAAHGITAVHAMDVDHDGVITEVILQQIRDAEFLVADLTGARPSVYYEVGYAHALGKRPMLVRRRGTGIHFDLSVHNAPEYEDPADLKRLMRRRLNERIGPSPKGMSSDA